MSARFTSIDRNARTEQPTKGGVILLRIDHALVARVLETKRVRWQNKAEVRTCQ